MGVIVRNDTEDYIQGRYLSFSGGDTASKVFPPYETLEGYETLDFYYFDGRKKTNFFHQYFVSFVLDVRYSEETYYKKKSEIESNEELVNQGDFAYERKERTANVAYGIFFGDGNNTIRYVAVCGKGLEEVSLGALMIWNIPLDHLSNKTWEK